MMKQQFVLPLLPSIGTCHPNTCNQADVQNLLQNGLNKVYSLLPETPELMLAPYTISCVDRHKPSLDGAAIAMIIILSIIFALAMGAGIVDYWQTHYAPNSSLKSSRAYKYLLCFSVYTNTQKLLSTRRSSEDLGCLHGIRFLSTAWVVLGHSQIWFMQGPTWARINFNMVYKRWTNLAIINGTFSVDTFFLMSGMLATYSLLKLLDKNKGRLNIPMLYIHRYIRLTPCYAILIGIVATLIKYVGNGPLWDRMEVGETSCRKNWWTNLLYINNIVNNDEMCNGESWYLSNDMQFFVLSPFIVYPMWKWEVMGTLLLVIYTILSCIAPVLVVRYSSALPGAILTRLDVMEGFPEIYYRPWSRISTFLVGIWLGWILHKMRGQRVALSKPVTALLWMLSTGTALAVIFGVFNWFEPEYSLLTVAGYFYAGLGRFAWAVAISWVIFACLKGYGGVVNEFLSWKIFMPLGRLCFSVYLVSFHVQGIFHSRLSAPMKWDTYTLVNLFFSHMVMSYLLGFFCTLFFESPFIVLQKLIFESPRKERTVNTKGTVEVKDPEKGMVQNNDRNNSKSR